MSDIIEISELNDNDLFFEKPKTKTNFGGGLEFLMNDKVSSNNIVKSDINLDDLDALENELNDLVEDGGISSKPKSYLFGGSNNNEQKPSVRFNSIGKSTAETVTEDKTWDGYGKYNNIPMNNNNNESSSQKMSNDEILKKKFTYIQKFDEWEKKGVQMSKKYTYDDNLQEMIAEHDSILENKIKKNNVKYYGQMLLTLINGIEMLNSKFDPFDIKLDGLAEQISENLNDYDDVFEELSDKYKDSVKIAPELKLIFKVGSAAAILHVTNTMFKNAVPGMDELLRQDPKLMRDFQNAVSNSMAKNNPGFDGFMNNLASDRSGGPPPPIATQDPKFVPPQARPGNNNFSQNYENTGQNKFKGDDRFMFSESNQPEKSYRSNNNITTNKRPEMKGPSDISNILSGLKTKSINIQEPPPPSQNQNTDSYSVNENSTISINDLKDLQNEGNVPKRSRRKKSSSNTVSLDI
jgi:hypothetical protein